MHKLSELAGKIRTAKMRGLTRVEVSFRFGESEDYCFGLPFMKHHFHEKAAHLVGELVSQVLNYPDVLRYVYWEADLYRVTMAIANLPQNILIVGRCRAWHIVASTCHPNHFVGTERAIQLKPGGGDRVQLNRLHDFVCRFANPGARIAVFHLNGEHVWPQPLSIVWKRTGTMFQLPSCSCPPTNGIYMDAAIRIPLHKNDLQESWIDGWEDLRQALVEKLKSIAQATADEKKKVMTRLALRRQLEAEMDAQESEERKDISSDNSDGLSGELENLENMQD